MEKREKILNVAKKLFAKRGYEATSMDEISRKASINKSLIYYYFGSKQILYSEVLLISIRSIHDYLIDKVDLSDDPKTALRHYLEAYYMQAKSDDTFIRILMREIASNGAHLTDGVVKRFLDTLSILDEILKKGCDMGIFTQKDVKVVHFIVVGAISFYLSSVSFRKSLSKKFPERERLLKEVDNFPEELFEIVVKGLACDG